MNEKLKKTIVSIIFLLLVVCIVIQSVVDNNAIRRADTTIDTLGTELADAQSRIGRYREEIGGCRATVDECRGSIRRINNGLERQSSELKDIIDNLKTVRAEVENMENALNQFYDKYGYLDDSIDSD